MKTLLFLCACSIAGTTPSFSKTPACAGYTGWTNQTNPPTDAVGLANTNFPEASSTTYWTSLVKAAAGSKLTIHGQYPLARFMSLEIYTADTLVDFIQDTSILPDPGQNNPFVSGTANGTYTAYLIFGPKPPNPAPNTLYTGALSKVNIDYRIYHATDPTDPAAGATNPVSPQLWLNGHPLINCPVQPIIEPPDSTVWGRLAGGDWMGTPPTGSQVLKVQSPPPWQIKDPTVAHFFPNGSNYYMGATLSHQFLKPNGTADVFVVHFLAPTFPNTRAGEPVYLDREVRFWSLCTDDPFTTNVNRCIPDDAVPLDANGYATFVVSDPGSKPSADALANFSAAWLAWGALYLPTDVVYDRVQAPWGINTPVHYYNSLIYRQTIANPSFAQSFQNIAKLPVDQQKGAMGPYWPSGGYCTKANFESYGIDCIGR